MDGAAEAVVRLLLAAQVAGCLGGDDGPAATPPPSSPTPPTGGDTGGDAGDDGGSLGTGRSVPTTLFHSACRQYHGFFATPWSDWAASMPEGFGPDGEDPSGTATTVYMHVSACTWADAVTSAPIADFGELWISVRVTPPAELALAGAVVQLVPLDVVVSDAGLAAVYGAWGFGDVVGLGSITTADTPAGAARVGEITVTADHGTYTLRAQLGPPQEGSAAGVGRVFAVTDRVVTGWFDYSWPGWTDLGYGSVAFTYEGSGDAPPAYAGSIHQVEATDVTLGYAPYAAAAP